MNGWGMGGELNALWILCWWGILGARNLVISITIIVAVAVICCELCDIMFNEFTQRMNK